MKWVLTLLQSLGSEKPEVRGAARLCIVGAIFVLIALLWRDQRELVYKIEKDARARFDTVDFVTAETLRAEKNTPDVLTVDGLKPVTLSELDQAKREYVREFLYSVNRGSNTPEERDLIAEVLDLMDQ